jgi:anti-sigma B factor antagonist
VILNVEQKTAGPDVAVLVLSGRIAMGSDSQKIEWALAELLKEGQRKVVLDLGGVNFLDSSGVGILMMCHAKLKRVGGALHVAGASGVVRETLELTSVDKIIPMFPTQAEAAAVF